MTQYYIGLMSGTSMDGIDAVLVDFANTQPQLIAQHSIPLPKQVLSGLHRLCAPSQDEINTLGQLDRQMGECFAQAVNELLVKANVAHQQIIAIGSHGQTVRHMPNLNHGFTLQIGDANTIAVNTNIDVIADFRRKDIALGGQGAPLVPAFHQAVFNATHIDRIILNIGGIANITYLPQDKTADVIGFDTGPGNTLMDAWMRQTMQQSYDKDGALAASGHTDDQLLRQMLLHPYFSEAFPKSTGRELFNRVWFEQQLSEYTQLSDADIQSTLLDFTCHSIANDIKKLSNEAEVYVCGGGAFNSELMRRLAELLPQHKLANTAKLGVSPQWVEAMAFAWLAMRFTTRQTANLPAVTGASRAAILGALYPAN